MSSEDQRADFEFRTFERFPRAVGLVRGQCVALVQQTDAGFRLIGEPGWLIGENVGVLTSSGGHRYFQFKSETLEATPERLAELERFRADVMSFLESGKAEG